MNPAAMVYVSDVSASLAFYEAVLEVSRHHEDDDGSYGKLHHGYSRLGAAIIRDVDGVLVELADEGEATA